MTNSRTLPPIQFATILSEARKYGLNLTVANQYIAQMPMEVKDAVFGNVGSIIAFRTSADDARGMLNYFEPKFEEHDLVHMHNRHFIISMTIEGEKVPAFSAISLNLPPQGEDHSDRIIDRSRAQYASSKEYVERYVHERYLDGNKPKQQDAPPPKPQPKVEPTKSPLSPTALAQAVLASQVAKPESAGPQTPPKSPPQHTQAPTAAPPATPNADHPPSDKPKRKRKRRKKSAAGQSPSENATNPRPIVPPILPPRSEANFQSESQPVPTTPPPGHTLDSEEQSQPVPVAPPPRHIPERAPHEPHEMQSEHTIHLQ